MTDLGAKLDLFDRNAQAAVDEMVAWLTDHGGDLIALARGRHVEGHYRYEDKGLFEHSHRDLLAEAAQELADAIVYLARRKHLLDLATGVDATRATRVEVDVDRLAARAGD